MTGIDAVSGAAPAQEPWEPVLDAYRHAGKFAVACRACPLRCFKRSATLAGAVRNLPCRSLNSIQRTMEGEDYGTW